MEEKEKNLSFLLTCKSICRPAVQLTEMSINVFCLDKKPDIKMFHVSSTFHKVIVLITAQIYLKASVSGQPGSRSTVEAWPCPLMGTQMAFVGLKVVRQQQYLRSLHCCVAWGHDDRPNIFNSLVISWLNFEKCKLTTRVENYLVSSIVSYFRTKQETAVVYEGF